MALPSILAWATASGAVDTPPAGQQTSGWQARQKPPNRWMNWLFNRLGDWTAYLHADIGTGREAGAYYKYASARTFRQILTPAFGGFVPLSSTPAAPTLTDEGLRSASSTDAAWVYMPLQIPRQTDSAIWSVTSIGVTYKIDAGGGSVNVRLIELDAADAAGPTPIGTALVVSTATGGAWTEATPQAQTGVTLDPNKSYAVRIQIDPVSGATDVQVANVVLLLSKTRVE